MKVDGEMRGEVRASAEDGNGRERHLEERKVLSSPTRGLRGDIYEEDKLCGGMIALLFALSILVENRK